MTFPCLFFLNLYTLPDHIPSLFMMQKRYSKVLLLGSGALKIGEAGEFDYSGSQAIKALKEEGIQVVLVNPNIATNQTSADLADEVYFLPVTPEFVTKVIEKERPDGIMLAWGGQTALNCGVALENSGVLQKYGVSVLGTPVASIEKTEDREIFNAELSKIGIDFPRSIACESREAAYAAIKQIKFPAMIRAAFTLGGGGSGFANNDTEFADLVEKAFSYSPQILVEESLKGWKEIEYEVVRDAADNCITVCNMENFDPLGIHTGESIVIAPSQTLNNREHQMLRTIALKTIRHLGIVGECNIQYALDPKSERYRVIEVNARLSRSSALASKATGYPLAYVAAKLALGYTLPDLPNTVTGVTKADFEPALDYVVLKIPRWDLDKFRKVSNQISSEMKSVGEIMAIGRSFEEVLQKGLRMLQIGAHGLSTSIFQFESLEYELSHPSPKRVFAIAKAMSEGMSPDIIHELTKIDHWFLSKIKNIVAMKPLLHADKGKDLDLLRKAKKLGFSDVQIANYFGKSEAEVRALRKENGITPVVKQIDTLAAEFPAQTNYLYLTYHGDKHDISFASEKEKKTVVLGSGSYCIGSSVEFDWASVNAIKALEKAGHETIMINYNPETVSTDFDTCDKLYFDELSLERVLDIVDLESPTGIILSTGGQIPNNLALKLRGSNLPILGTTPENIDKAESRQKFSALCDELDIDQPEWRQFSTLEEAENFAKKVGFPVLVRPSYVLSGAAMSVAHSDAELRNYVMKAARISTEAPVVVSKFELNAREIEIDAVAGNGELLIYAISEHIENAGVHSGDATIVLPPQKTYLETIRRVKQIAKKLAKALNITGPFNMQLLARDNMIKVIELNLRASRSFPFVSKVTGHNFIEIAVNAMLGDIEPLEVRKAKYQTLDLDWVGVKAPQFSFSRLRGADPVLGVEMASTGEVGCFGRTLEEAFLKSMLSVGFRLPQKGAEILVSAGMMEQKISFLEAAKRLIEMGYSLAGTPGTAEFFTKNSIPMRSVTPENSVDEIENGRFGLVINVPKNYQSEEVTNGYKIRRKCIDRNIPLLTNIQIAKVLVRALELFTPETLPIESWREVTSSV